MSIVDTYKSEFKIFSYDEDTLRGQELEEQLKKQGYQFTVFNSRGLFYETLDKELPHVFILFYQPLNLKFREMLTKIREASPEIEVIILGANQFWPGIQNLLKANLATDFWSWPVADPSVFEFRLNQVLEKNIYKFIAEQRGDETAHIVAQLEDLRTQEPSTMSGADSLANFDFVEAGVESGMTEAKAVDKLISDLKLQHPAGDFIFLKNYPARNQLLATKTSFSQDNYFRGQSLPFDEEDLQGERGDLYNRVRTLLEQTFNCEDFIIQPVELGSEFFGFLMAVNFEGNDFLQKASRYLGLSLRNCRLESGNRGPDRDLKFDRILSSAQFPLALSTEISRARRLKLPVSLVTVHLEYVTAEKREREAAMKVMEETLREYDFIAVLDDQRFAMILPHCRYADAAVKAETLRRRLVARGLKTQNTPLRLCSGVSEFPSLSQDSDSLITDAQKACSQVLVSGKNKVCLYSAVDGFEPEFIPQTL